MDSAKQKGPNSFMTLDKLFIVGFIIYLILGWYLSVSEFSTKFLKSCKKSEYSIISGICDFIEDKFTLKGLSVILFLLGSYIWLMLIYYVNIENTRGPKQYNLSRTTFGVFSLTSFLSNICILIVIVALLLLFIMATLHALGEWSRTTSAVLTTLNILNLITILSIVYIYFIKNIDWGEAPNSIFSLIKNVIFYIPCIFISIIETISGEYNQTPRKAVILLIIEAVIVTLYFLLPMLTRMVKDQIGHTLLDKPVYLSNQYTLGSYETLIKHSKTQIHHNKDNTQSIIESIEGNNTSKHSKSTDDIINIDLKDFYLGEREIKMEYAPQKWPSNKMPAKYNYNYALSSWIYINPQPPSTNHHYSDFTRLLDYGGKPTINYKGKNNTIQIVMDIGKDGKKIIYEDSTFPLQKWNHILINYDGGTLDVFINNSLVSSTPSVVPYMSHDMIYSGVDNGIHGGITNVTYFDDVLDKNEISLLYETSKVNNPPLL